MAGVTLSKILYGFAFVVVLPLLLVAWAAGAGRNIGLPAFGDPASGVLIACLGIVVMAAAAADLWRFGGGLPMNAFPPGKLVKRGTYGWIPHPIYTGFVAACLGASMAARSASGIWLVTPSMALACAALVLGYERPDMQRRLGATLHILPADEETRPGAIDIAHYYLCAVLPWVLLYEITIRIGAGGRAFRFAFEGHLPVWPWTAVIYQSLYLAVAAAPWLVRTRRELRQLMVSAWVATLVVFPIYWVLPSSAPRRPIVVDGWIVHLLRFERDTYPPVAAFPSFHVLWTIFVARLFRPRWIGFLYVAAVSASCITTSMHYVADVLLALLLAPAFIYPHRPWEWLRMFAERTANSWRAWQIGPLRIVNYSLFAGLAGALQVAIVMSAAGPGRERAVLTTAIAGIAGSAIWAQWLEGSSRLRRPFGFYGGLIAVAICCLFFKERWTLLGAHCLAAPWMQALGRVRCLVNGCCHGAPAPQGVGIRVVNESSRVTRLAELRAVPIHATPLYSILSNALLGSFLLRLWASGCHLSLICGVYAIGSGCARFVEEAYRGEPQTIRIAGLRLYQWLAVIMVVTGAAVTALASPPPPVMEPSAAGFMWAAAFGILAAAGLGMEFPSSDRPFARLT